MSNENPNNTPGWRNKLDEFEHLPGSSFNNDAAWDKLYGRLRGNKRNRKIFWYWIAAACLFFGLVITFLNYQKDNSETGNKETALKQQPKEINKPVLKGEKPDKNENENRVELVKNKIVSTPNKPTERKLHIVQTEVTTKARHDDILTTDQAPEPLAKPLQIINTNSTATVIPQKKKLNVVHINELGDPVIESSDITRIEDIHSFKLKFGNGEVFSSSPVASKSSGLIILKTKPASN